MQLKKPFSSPSEGQPAESSDLKRRLAMRRRFVPWGGGSFNPLSFQGTIAEEPDEEAQDEGKEENKALEQAKAAAPAVVDENPLILWRPGEFLPQRAYFERLTVSVVGYLWFHSSEASLQSVANERL